MVSQIGTRNGRTSESAMSSTPRLFVIQTSSEEVSVTAMDFEDAVQTWGDGGGLPAEILAVEEHENHSDQTIH